MGGKNERRKRHVTVYTRAGCHLCDEACHVLERHGLSPKTIDIDSDPILREQYTDCVPVVAIDGQVRFRGRVNEVLLRRLLQGRSISAYGQEDRRAGK